MPNLRSGYDHFWLSNRPRQDGFTNRYYKKLSPILLKPVCYYFNAITTSNPQPKEALLAHITVFPKTGKDSDYCPNNRPILFPNKDTKMFSKLLATSFQDHVASIVHLDQIL